MIDLANDLGLSVKRVAPSRGRFEVHRKAEIMCRSADARLDAGPTFARAIANDEYSRLLRRWLFEQNAERSHARYGDQRHNRV